MAEERGNLLGEYIRNWLNENKATANGLPTNASTLATETKVSHSTIGNILNGVVTHPTNRTLELLSGAMKIEFHILANLVTGKATHEYSPEAMVTADIQDNLPSDLQSMLMAYARQMATLAAERESDVGKQGKAIGGQKVKKSGKIKR